jgi:hypothetical protein
MRRLRSIIVLLALGCPAGSAGAFDLPAEVVDLHGRIESVVIVDERSGGFAHNHDSRSPAALTRLMSSVEAGNDRYGRLYLKGVAAWDGSRDGSVEFVLDQGDYLWRYGRDLRHTVRVFGNERRYFTGAIAPALVDDAAVDRFENHGGVRVDGAGAEAWSWTALGGVLDEGDDTMRGMGYAAVRWMGNHAQAALSYLGHDVQSDSTRYRAAVKGEVAGFYRRATMIVSYENSGFDDRAVFLPEGSFDWDGYVGSNFAASLPGAAAAFGEIRVAGINVRDRADLSLFHRYRAVGPEFTGTLSDAVPGTVTHTTGLFLSHRRLALDARLFYRKQVRWRLDDRTSERIEAHTHACLKNGTRVLLRAAVGHRDEPGDVRSNDNFVHAAVSRSMRRLQAGVHVMVKDIDDGEFERRFAAEARMNWTATLSLYGRLITSEDAGSNDAVYCRLEVRPARHVFATVGYGRAIIGDDPYLLEDADIGATGNIESVYTISVRGDF